MTVRRHFAFCSGKAIVFNMRAAYRLGAVGYMLKPAGSDELNDAMGKLVQSLVRVDEIAGK